MNHIVYSPQDKITVIYDDENKTITDADDEFIHAMLSRLMEDTKSSGRILDKIRSLYHSFMWKCGIPVPEFFTKTVIDDKKSGTRYIVKMEIIPGGCLE